MSGKHYISVEGFKTLSDELNHLLTVERPSVVNTVAAAAAEGDRSENAEYIYGKKQLREIDRRIRYLSKRLDEVVVVDRRPADAERVYFGAWVDLENDEGETARWRIVGADEFDPARHWISIDSPAARALVGKRVDDEVRVRGPEGDLYWVVVAIHYDDPDAATQATT